jgi:hypothetical protein
VIGFSGELVAMRYGGIGVNEVIAHDQASASSRDVAVSTAPLSRAIRLLLLGKVLRLRCSGAFSISIL